MKLLEPGSVLDGFVIGELVHSGGMAHIYSVTGRETGFPLAMKVPRIGACTQIAAFAAHM